MTQEITTMMQSAISIVAATGTARETVRVSYDEMDGLPGWTVQSWVLTFSSPTGKRRSGGGTLKVSGWSAENPLEAARDCVASIHTCIRDGYAITGGRCEIATK